MANKSFLKGALFFAVGLILLSLTSSCNKDDDPVPMMPPRNWRVEYTVTSIADIEINSITYVDEFGMEQTILGQREFSIVFEAETGFVARMTVKATATNGGVVANIDAIALDNSGETAFDSADDGQTGGTPKAITLNLELELP